MIPKLLTFERWSLNFCLLNSKYHSFILVDVQKGDFLRWHCRPKTSNKDQVILKFISSEHAHFFLDGKIAIF